VWHSERPGRNGDALGCRDRQLEPAPPPALRGERPPPPDGPVLPPVSPWIVGCPLWHALPRLASPAPGFTRYDAIAAPRFIGLQQRYAPAARDLRDPAARRELGAVFHTPPWTGHVWRLPPSPHFLRVVVDRTPPEVPPGPPAGHFFLGVVGDFCRAVRTGEPTVITGLQVLQIQAVVDALYASARARREVAL
jgi:hypothetical protein